MKSKELVQFLNKLVDHLAILTVALNLVELLTSFHIPVILRFPVFYIPLALVLIYGTALTVVSMIEMFISIIIRIVKYIILGINKFIEK